MPLKGLATGGPIMREKKRCLNCCRTVEEPPTTRTSDYARFWRDQCPVCDGQLVPATAPPSPAAAAPSSLATASPHHATFPLGPQRNRLQTASRISSILAGVFAVPAIAMITLQAVNVPIEHWNYLVVTAPLFLLSVSFAIAFRLNGKKMAADIQNLTTKVACWAHWRYSEEEWRSFMQAEWANRKSPARSLPKVVFAVTMVSLALPLVGRRDPPYIGEYVRQVAIMIPIVFGLVLMVGAINLAAARRTYRRSVNAPSEAFIGPKGVMIQGHYSSWAFLGVTLRSVAVKGSHPAVLEFRMHVWQGRFISQRIVRLPVPEGHEWEASRLVSQFGRLPDSPRA